MRHHYVQLRCSSNQFVRQKGEKYMCNNDGKETKETKVVFRVCSYVFEQKKREKKSIT
jgi:hypothetical protein